MVDPAKETKTIYRIISWLLIGAGIILRSAQYFSNKSLWQDELLLIFNITNKHFNDFFHTLDYNQYAPTGFLIIEKLLISALGINEFIFRLFPFICSIISLFLFYKLCKKCVSDIALLIATGLFSILVSLIYYSAETKQYSSDVLFSLMLVLIIFKLSNGGLTLVKTVFYGLCGAVIIWFSHTAILILAGEGIYLLASAILKKDFRRTLFILVFCLLWGMSFLVFYFNAFEITDATKGLVNYWKKFYLPLSPFSISGILIYKKIFNELSRFLTFDIFPWICFLTGLVVCFKDKKENFYILSTPIITTLIVSGLQKYPIYERFILFLIPLIILFVSIGATWIIKKAPLNIVPIFGFIIICLLFYKPIHFTTRNFTNPLSQEETRPVLSYIKEHLKNGDVLYISDPIQYAFKYYAQNYNFCSEYSIKQYREKITKVSCNEFNHRLILGAAASATVNASEFDKIPRSKRVWLIFSDKLSEDVFNKKFTLDYLDKIGVKTGSFIRPGVSAYLYDLSIKSDHQ